MSNNTQVMKREDAIKQIDTVYKDLSTKLTGQVNEFEKSMHLAFAMEQLFDLVEAVKSPVMMLMNTHLGFMTDADPSRNRKCERAYKWEEIKPVICEALVAVTESPATSSTLFHAVSTQLKTDCGAKLETWRALTNFRDEIAVPKTISSGAIVSVKASWNRTECLKTPQPKSQLGERFMGIEAIIGKAQRKLFKRVLDILTGSRWDTLGDEDGPTYEAESEAKVETEALPKPKSKADQIKDQIPAAEPIKAESKKLTGLGQVLDLCERDDVKPMAVWNWLVENEPSVTKGISALTEVADRQSEVARGPVASIRDATSEGGGGIII
jgi:hypothetical protein